MDLVGVLSVLLLLSLLGDDFSSKSCSGAWQKF